MFDLCYKVTENKRFEKGITSLLFIGNQETSFEIKKLRWGTGSVEEVVSLCR